MNPFGEDNFGEESGEDSKLVNALYMYSIAKTLADVRIRLSMVKSALQARPDVMPVETSFNLVAIIGDYLEKSQSLMDEEAKRILATDETARENLRQYGINPDDLI